MGTWLRSAVILDVTALLLTTAICSTPSRAKADDPVSQGLWPLVGGDATRSAQVPNASAPYLEPTWIQSLLREGRDGAANAWLKQADGMLQHRHPAIPAFQPITVTVKPNRVAQLLVVCRTHAGLVAIELATGKIAWEQPSKWSLEGVAQGGKQMQTANGWVNWYISNNRPGIVYENSIVGTISTDGTYVFTVEDFAVPPPPWVNEKGKDNADKDFAEALASSKLEAYELTSGKMKWQIGGTFKGATLADSFFLGAPLPLDGNLYVVAQTPLDADTLRDRKALALAAGPQLPAAFDPAQQQLSLACLAPDTGKLQSQLALLKTIPDIRNDIDRRIAAVHIAAADGLLVVVTNAGSAVGADLKTRKVKWTTAYQEKEEAPNLRPGFPRQLMNNVPNAATRWKVTPPIVRGGKVVFTAPDSQHLTCLNLKDGKLDWKVKRADEDLYLAGVFGDTVLVVGKRTVKGYTLAKGDLAWTLETGLPGGFGVAGDNVYYLPVLESHNSKEPEICQIDVAKGKIMAHVKPRVGIGQREVPGNLLFADGRLLSQTGRALTLYPLLKTRLVAIDALLAKTPNDPQGLFDRGELRLNQGDLPAATEDLRQVLANKPRPDLEARTRRLLFETLNEYFDRDFDKAEKYLKDYEDGCKIALDPNATPQDKEKVRAEEKERRGLFLVRVAKGREKQGKLHEALVLYLELAEADGDEMMPSAVEPGLKVSRKVWVRQRVGDLLKNAPPDKAKELQDEIEKKWKALQGARDLAPQLSFLTLVGTETAVGREARLEVAQTLLKAKHYLEAEHYLEAVRRHPGDEVRSGRAVYGLARLSEDASLLEDAAYYYKILKSDFATVKVHDEQTGKDVFDGLQTDKRFIPLLDGPATFPDKPLKVEEVKAAAAQGLGQPNLSYAFGQVGEALPFFKQYRLALTPTHNIRITNRYQPDEKPRMDARLSGTFFHQMLAIWNPQGGQINPEYDFRNSGHLVVLPLGHRVFAIDPVGGKLLWEKDLYNMANAQGLPQGGQQPNGMPPITVDPRDNTVQIIYMDAWIQRIGKDSLFVGTEVVVVATREGLVGLDLLTGKTIWRRDDVASGVALFGNDDFLGVVTRDGAGAIQTTRVLRTGDGTTVPAPDFRAAYEKSIGTSGHTLLFAEQDTDKPVALRGYDVATGKVVWKEVYPVGSRVLLSEDDALTGVVEPSGKVHVLTAKDGQEVVALKVDPKHLKSVATVYLFGDEKKLYLACNRPTDPNLMPWGGVQSNVETMVGLRTLPINGELYAFARADGALAWHNDVINQLLLRDQFDRLPVLLFSARYTTWINPAHKGVVNKIGTLCIRKSTGKLLYNQEVDNNGQQAKFSALTVDPGKGEIELIRFPEKLRITLKKE